MLDCEWGAASREIPPLRDSVGKKSFVHSWLFYFHSAGQQPPGFNLAIFRLRLLLRNFTLHIRAGLQTFRSHGAFFCQSNCLLLK